MKITKQQLRKIIKEELKEAMGADIPGKEATLDFLKGELQSWHPSALARLRDVLQTESFDLTVEILDMIEPVLAAFVDAQDLPSGRPRYETSAESDLAKWQSDRFGGR